MNKVIRQCRMCNSMNVARDPAIGDGWFRCADCGATDYMVYPIPKEVDVMVDPGNKQTPRTYTPKSARAKRRSK